MSGMTIACLENPFRAQCMADAIRAMFRNLASVHGSTLSRVTPWSCTLRNVNHGCAALRRVVRMPLARMLMG
jgi:hypothetical protein